MSDLDTTERIRALQASVTGDGRTRHRNTYFNVSWHVKQKAWRVKIYFQGKAFYKEFPLAQELQAAWVADVAGVMIKGSEAMSMGRYVMRTKSSSALNFDWSGGIPQCPENTYSIYDVYGWLVDRKVPVRLKPSAVNNNDYHQQSVAIDKTK